MSGHGPVYGVPYWQLRYRIQLCTQTTVIPRFTIQFGGEEKGTLYQGQLYMGNQFKDIYIKLLYFEKLYWYGKSGETVNQGIVNQGKTVVCICIIRA